MSPSSIFIFIFSIFILHIGALAYVADALFPVEKQALLTFINTQAYNTRLRYSWNESQPACSSWVGIACDPTNSTVLYLRLPEAGLTGEIPPKSIGKLTSLRVLSLPHNHLSGVIPSDFSDLKYLIGLYLNNNNFSGQLPYIISDRLRYFNVSSNTLNGSIPYSLSKFPISAFSGNGFLCGSPLPPCSSSYPPGVNAETRKGRPKVMRRETPGVSAGSGLLLLIVVCCVGKKMYQRMKPPLKELEMERRCNLVSFDGGFDLEYLLTKTLKVLGRVSVRTSDIQELERKNTTVVVELVRENTTVVVKILKGVVVTGDEFRTTMEALGKMKNKHVVPLRAFYNYSNDKLLVYDYMHVGSLSARLHGSTSSDRTQLDSDRRMRIALSVANGLAYLHFIEEVVHGNIKSSNIFFQQEANDEVLLSDYGLYALFHESRSLKATAYWAPEVLETQNFTFKSDVYSFGVLLLELLTGKNPNELDKEGVHFSKWVGSIVCEEPKFELELTRDQDHSIDKMVQLFQIAKDCVSIVPNQRPQMRNVASMINDILLIQSSDYHSMGYDDKPSMKTHDTLSTITIGSP